MNKNLLFSSFISISFHALFLFIPLGSIFTRGIDIDIMKGPASIEVSLAHSTPSFEVKAQKIDKIPLDRNEENEAEQFRDERIKNSINSKPMTGAITDQISSLMINRPPAYPAMARIKGWEGEVVLLVNISERGEVGRVDTLSSSGYYVLDNAAIKAINTWRFRNMTRPSQLRIPIRFVLTENR